LDNLARNCLIFQKHHEQKSPLACRCGFRSQGADGGQQSLQSPDALSTGSLDKVSGRRVHCSSGMKLAIRLASGRRFQRPSLQGRFAHTGSPLPTRPRKDRAARAHAHIRCARHFTSCGARPRAPALGAREQFGRSPGVLGAIGMRPDRVDERLERLAANRSG
jgi:hypothetical protein